MKLAAQDIDSICAAVFTIFANGKHFKDRGKAGMSNEQEQLTMKKRIDAFYRQSGGPGNPEIAKILDEHLKYGKDHGVKGRIENIKDAFAEVFLNDRSMKPVVMGLMKLQMNLKKEWERYLDVQRPGMEQLIEKLKERHLSK